MSTSIIACRAASYAPFEERACEHLPTVGIRHVEIPVPPAEQIETTRAKLAAHGLTASTLHGECDVQREDVAQQVESQMPALAAFGTRILFVSCQGGETPRDVVYQRLRQVGEVAARHDVTVVMETHPDLVTNAQVALATMKGVDHPNVRVNFDTANIYFYNQEADVLRELRDVAPYVAAVHLKDTDGGYRHWHFPALGRGIVPFDRVFRLLDEAGFAGPCTLEVEGIEGEKKTEQLVCERIAESADFLRKLGRL